ncbi:MAG TPA: VWA domain-containing protein [Thermoanaerobaculia bacterium]|nr:VWA domain-containing protein [Thermoanaerobaculia bacterium]
MRRAYVALAVFFVASLLTADSIQKLPPLVERIDVSVTNVDVVVTDGAGHPVGGLSRDDFEIYEDGVPQFLTNFYAIQDATVRLATREDSSEGSVDPDQFRRKIVLLIDNNFIPKPSRDAALARLDEFLESHVAANCEWTLIAIGHTVTTVQPFTSSKKQMHAAIDRVRHMPTFDEQRSMDREILSDPVRRTGLIDALGNNDFGTTVQFKAREQTMRNLGATQNTARAVIQTCRAFTAAEGKKIVILVTGGMEMNTTFKAYEGQGDPILSEMKRQTEETLDLIVREANAANVNLYVIAARNRGMQAPQHDVVNKSAGTNPGTVGSMQDVLGGGPIDTTDVDTSSRILAMGTGGLYLPANNVGRGLDRIDEETSTYYSLGFSPQHGEDGVYHHISVRVKQRGLEVRHREGYTNVSLDQRLEQSLLAPITLPKEQGSLPVRLALGIPDADKEGLAVPVVAELPLRLFAIVPHDEAYAGRVHIYLSIYDGDGNNVGYHHFVKDLTVARDEYACINTAVFHYRTTLRLKPGQFTILVTLRDDVTNELGTAMQILRL